MRARSPAPTWRVLFDDLGHPTGWWRTTLSLPPHAALFQQARQLMPRVRVSVLSRARPDEELLSRPGVDHPLDRYTALDGPFAAVALPVQLTGGVGIGVDGELAAG